MRHRNKLLRDLCESVQFPEPRESKRRNAIDELVRLIGEEKKGEIKKIIEKYFVGEY